MSQKEEKQQKIVLQLMFLCLVVVTATIIIIALLWMVNIINSDLALINKSSFNLAVILAIGFIFLPSLYQYFNKLIVLLEIAKKLKKKTKNLEKIIKEIDQVMIKIEKDKIEIKKEMNSWKSKLNDAKKETEKQAIAKLEKIWENKWKHKFVQLERLKKKK